MPSTLRRLVASARVAAVDPVVEGDADTEVTGITLDSRDVRPGDLFAALPGEHTHGRHHIGEALQRGARAVLTDPEGSQDLQGLPGIVTADPRGILGTLSSLIYREPSRDLTLIAITGTNGKTTVAHLVAAGLTASGSRVGLIGTTGVSIHDERLPAVRTTPEAPHMHALLAVMRERGVTDVVMEVSSHALVLGRVDGLRFDIAGFTNLSPDHLDFHGDMESYFAAKAMLFTPERARQAVVCVDDDAGRRIAATTTIPVTTVSMDSESDADVTCRGIEVDTHNRQVLTLRADGHDRRVDIGLAGDFNAANAAVAWGILHQLGVTDRVIDRGLAGVSVPGRMEIIDAGQDFSIIVDYAHSPDAVERVIGAITANGRIIVVLGCGGDRDMVKRPEMGRVAAEGATLLIVTDDNPRSEDPAKIRTQMLAGVPSERRDAVVEIGDRRAAIRSAIEQARAGDVVLILGKGHETGQEIDGVVHPFDDRVEVRSMLGQVAS